MSHTGTCLCGTLHFVVTGEAGDTLCCHCRDCQLASGAPFLVWTVFPAGAFQLQRGALETTSVAGRIRTRCATCGSPVTFRDPTLPGELEVATMLLEPAPTPSRSEWIADRPEWVPSLEQLPTYHHGP